MATKQADK